MRKRGEAWRGAILVAGLAFLLSACGRGKPQNSLDPAGPYARKIDALFDPVFWIAVAVFVLVEGLLVVALVRFRHRPGNPVPRQILVYSVVLVAVSLVLWPVGHTGWLYPAAAVVLGGLFVARAIHLRRTGTTGAAMSLFRYSIAYLALLFAAVAVDTLVRLGR